MPTPSTNPATTPTDPSPYIRTYAKDVAALTGQKINPSQTPFPKKDTLTASPKVNGGQEIERAQTQKEIEQEAEARLQDNSSVASGVLQSISLPSIEPGDIIAAAPAPIGTKETVSREDILARLRSKIATTPQTETPLMPSSFTTAPIVESEPLPAPTPAPAIDKKSEPSPFHSFSSDFADRIDEQHASTFSVLAAEKDKTPKKERPRKKLNILPIAAGIVLVIAGGAGIFAAYRFMTATVPVATTPTMSYLISPDEKISLSGNGPSLLAALAQQATQPLPADTVLLTYINVATTTTIGVTETPGTGGDFLAALNLPAPDVLLRNIDPSSMVGIVNDGTQTRPFFILQVDSYESTFAGMLEWEPTIGSDLSALYPAYPAPVQTVSLIATSTATTTVASKTKTSTKTAPAATVPAPLPPAAPSFIDEVVDNHDARALKDAEGRTILIYGYADKQTLVIARDEAAFTLLLSRLEGNQ